MVIAATLMMMTLLGLLLAGLGQTGVSLRAIRGRDLTVTLVALLARHVEKMRLLVRGNRHTGRSGRLLVRVTVSLVVGSVASLELAVVTQVLDLVTVPDIVPALGDLVDLVLAVASDLLRARFGPLWRAALVHRLTGGVQRRLPRQLLDLQHGSLARTTLSRVATPTRFRSRALVLIARRGYVEVLESIPGTDAATTDLTNLMTLMMMMMMMVRMIMVSL